MTQLTWQSWYRSEGAQHHMDRARFGGKSFSAIFWQAMRNVFFDEHGRAGALYEGSVGEVARQIVGANGRRFGFAAADQGRMLEAGDVVPMGPLVRIRIEGPDLPEDDLIWAKAAQPGSVVEFNFYRVIEDARTGFGGRLPRIREDADGVRLLEWFVGAIVLHELMHSAGFSHPKRVTWTAGTAYASSLPHVAAVAVMLASPFKEYFERLIALDIDVACCGTSTAFEGAPYNIRREGRWSTGWTHLMPFELGGDPHFVIYSSVSGLVHFDRINADGGGSTTIGTPGWSAGWTHLMPFDLGGDPHFVIYNSVSGQAHVDRINADGRGSTTGGPPENWGAGWTHIVPYRAKGWPHAVVYNSATGVVQFRSLRDTNSALENAGQWDPGWTHLVPLTDPGVADAIAYRRSDGLTHFDRVFDKGWTLVAADHWSKEWHLLTPIRLGGAPGFIAYADDGLVHYSSTL